MSRLREFIKKYKLLFLFVIATISFFILGINQGQEEKKIIKINQITKNNFDYSRISEILAKSYYVYDISEDRALFSKDEHLQLPLASVTKLMSALVIRKNLPDFTIVEIKGDSIKEEGDSGFLIGEKWKLKNLLDFTLLTSSNDGVRALASALNAYEETSNKNIIDLMNEKAKELSLDDTFFINDTGLDVNLGISGAYSSSQNVATLLSYIVKNNYSLVSATAEEETEFRSEDNIKHIAKNTNTSINKIPSLLGSKTGFTELAQGNLTIVFDAGFGHPVVIVVLGSTPEGRFSDTENLVKLTLQKLSE